MYMFLQALACGTAALRAVNLLFGAACIPLFYFVHRQLHADTNPSTSLAAVRCCLLCTAPVVPAMPCRNVNHCMVIGRKCMPCCCLCDGHLGRE
jgi:hypothetical protein